jgi:hypothetical protein
VQDLVKAAQNLLRNFGLLIFPTADRNFLKCLRGRHPELSLEILNDLDSDFQEPIRSFDLKKLLKLGQIVEQLGHFALWVTSEAKSLGIPTYPFLTMENALTRLSNKIWRDAANTPSDSYPGAPLSEKEWKVGCQVVQKDVYNNTLNKIILTLPNPLQSYLLKRLTESQDEIFQFIGENKKEIRLPDIRFFGALSFRRSQEA